MQAQGVQTFAKSKAEEIYETAKELVPVLPKDNVTKFIVKQAARQLADASETVAQLKAKMNEAASNFRNILLSWQCTE